MQNLVWLASGLTPDVGCAELGGRSVFPFYDKIPIRTPSSLVLERISLRSRIGHGRTHHHNIQVGRSGAEQPGGDGKSGPTHGIKESRWETEGWSNNGSLPYRKPPMTLLYTPHAFPHTSTQTSCSPPDNRLIRGP